MVSNPHFFLGLAGAVRSFRKSRLMLASSFRVGTFFSASRFSLSFNGELL